MKVGAESLIKSPGRVYPVLFSSFNSSLVGKISRLMTRSRSSAREAQSLGLLISPGASERTCITLFIAELSAIFE